MRKRVPSPLRGGTKTTPPDPASCPIHSPWGIHHPEEQGGTQTLFWHCPNWTELHPTRLLEGRKHCEVTGHTIESTRLWDDGGRGKSSCWYGGWVERDHYWCVNTWHASEVSQVPRRASVTSICLLSLSYPNDPVRGGRQSDFNRFKFKRLKIM